MLLIFRKRKHDKGNSWDISPQERKDQLIGKLSISRAVGTIDYNYVLVGDEKRHNGLSDLIVRIVATPNTWIPSSYGDGSDYTVQYGIKTSSDTVISWCEPVNVRSSPQGSSFRGPYILLHQDCDDIYIVSPAAGNWGVTSEDKVVWNFRSNAYRLRLN